MYSFFHFLFYGDYNDGDYVTERTHYYLNNEDDIQRLTELLKILCNPVESECSCELGKCDQDCSEAKDDCQEYSRQISRTEQMSDAEIAWAIYELVDLPQGPYGVCHTLNYLDMTFFDANGVKHKLIDRTNKSNDWNFPLYVGTDHY